VAPDECVQDARNAIRWVREHAGELAIDPQRIVGAGGSAGGHLAACTGICPEPDASDDTRDESSIPNALVLFNPVLNFIQPKLTERLENDELRALAISPTRHLRRESPPTLLLYGADDPLLEQGQEFLTRSEELGHTAELFSAAGVGHGFFNRPPWLEKTLERVDEFLVAQGYLNRAEKWCCRAGPDGCVELTDVSEILEMTGRDATRLRHRDTAQATFTCHPRQSECQLLVAADEAG
jgi:acetyl esterase/lipase